MILPQLTIGDKFSLAVLNGMCIGNKKVSKHTAYFNSIASIEHFIKTTAVELECIKDLSTYKIIIKSNKTEIIFNPLEYLDYTEAQMEEFENRIYKLTRGLI
jgi:hypothetical protein